MYSNVQHDSASEFAKHNGRGLLLFIIIILFVSDTMVHSYIQKHRHYCRPILSHCGCKIIKY